MIWAKKNFWWINISMFQKLVEVLEWTEGKVNPFKNERKLINRMIRARLTVDYTNHMYSTAFDRIAIQTEHDLSVYTKSAWIMCDQRLCWFHASFLVFCLFMTVLFLAYQSMYAVHCHSTTNDGQAEWPYVAFTSELWLSRLWIRILLSGFDTIGWVKLHKCWLKPYKFI